MSNKMSSFYNICYRCLYSYLRYVEQLSATKMSPETKAFTSINFAVNYKNKVESLLFSKIR